MSHNPRVAVLAPDGAPLMPTTASRARKWIEAGKAVPKRTKEGVFYVQLAEEPSGRETQDMELAVDPGSKYDGYAVSGSREVALLGMAILPTRVRKRMEVRSQQRRTRRSRNCRRRKARFDNRKKKEGWMAPSQLAKVQLRTRLMERLCGLFPVTDVVIEDVKFDHYRKQGGKYFSTVEIGKTKVYEEARKLGQLWKIEGWQTAEARKLYGIEKCSDKSRLAPESHANDAWAMVCWLEGWGVEGDVSQFYIWRRQECSKRQLHLLQPGAGGERRRYGGTTHPSSKLHKGDLIRYRDTVIGYVGGWTSDGKVVSLVDGGGKRIRQAGVGTIRLLRRSPNILVERMPAHSSPH